MGEPLVPAIQEIRECVGCFAVLPQRHVGTREPIAEGWPRTREMGMEVEEETLRTHDPLEQHPSFRGFSLGEYDFSVETITVEITRGVSGLCDYVDDPPKTPSSAKRSPSLSQSSSHP
jgi:hypothetical protein